MVLIIAFGIYKYFFPKIEGKDAIAINDESQMTAEALREVIVPAKELVTYKYFYTDAGVYEDDIKIWSFSVPFTKTQQVYVYSGKMGIGIDMEDIEFDVQDVSKRVIINLPPLHVLYHELETDSLQAYDVKSSIFTRIDLSDYAEFEEKLKSIEEEKAEDNEELWANAKTNVEETIRVLLMQANATEDYSVQFKWND